MAHILRRYVLLRRPEPGSWCCHRVVLQAQHKLSRCLSSASPSSLEELLSAKNKERVQKRLHKIKPARKAQPGRENPKPAAVLVPLCTVDGVPSLLFTLRSTKLSSHKGQVSYPGGITDASDRDAVHTALRETEEELGLSPDHVDVWGTMTPVPGKNHNTLVTPVLGNLGDIDIKKLKFNKDEVAEVFAYSLESLCCPDNIGYTRFKGTKKNDYNLPVYVVQPHRIWGLTGVITHMALSALAPPPFYTFKLNILA